MCYKAIDENFIIIENDKVFVGIQVKKCPYFLVNGEIEIQCCQCKKERSRI